MLHRLLAGPDVPLHAAVGARVCCATHNHTIAPGTRPPNVGGQQHRQPASPVLATVSASRPHGRLADDSWELHWQTVEGAAGPGSDCGLGPG